jgi:hypothetical protein
LWEELFLTQLKSMRGWSAAQASDQFDMLINNPKNFRDTGGPRGTTRVEVPANLIGEEMNAKSIMETHSRQVQASSKQRKDVKDEEFQAMKHESGMGFSSLDSVSMDVGDTVKPLAGSASTVRASHAGEATLDAILESAMSSLGVGTPTQKGAADVDSGAPGSSPKKDGEEGELKPARVDPVKRNQLHREQSKEHGTERGKLELSVRQAVLVQRSVDKDLDADGLLTLKERLTIALLALGVEPAVDSTDMQENDLKPVYVMLPHRHYFPWDS